MSNTVLVTLASTLVVCCELLVSLVLLSGSPGQLERLRMQRLRMERLRMQLRIVERILVERIELE